MADGEDCAQPCAAVQRENDLYEGDRAELATAGSCKSLTWGRSQAERSGLYPPVRKGGNGVKH